MSSAAPSHLPGEVFSEPPTPAATRRILQEFKALQDANLPQVACSLEDDANVYVWRVELAPPPESSLANELRRYSSLTGSSPAVTLEVRFDGSFPFAPPFVRVVSPRFAFHTGHVTIGGSLCMAELTSTAWNPTFTMGQVLDMIAAALEEGDARLHETRPQMEYTLREAQRNFLRVAQQHGWV